MLTKMKQQITLESKELREIVAKALDIPEKQVVSLRYGIAIEGLSAEDVEQRIISLLGNR